MFLSQGGCVDGEAFLLADIDEERERGRKGEREGRKRRASQRRITE
jgi:hypothetical protein